MYVDHGKEETGRRPMLDVPSDLQQDRDRQNILVRRIVHDH